MDNPHQQHGAPAQFDLTRLDRYQSTRTSIKRPRHFLEFSFDDKHQIQLFSDQSLRYYYPPYIDVAGIRPPRVNLSNGFDSWQRHDDSADTHLDGLLEALQAHEERLIQEGVKAEDARVKADLVTWRGMMTKILTAAFDLFSEFEMNATYYQGTIYLEEDHATKQAEERRSKQSQRPPRPGEASQEMMQYWGYKFESLSSLPRPWAEVSRDEIANRDNEIVNNSSQYCSIVRTGIGSTSMILAGEVDCVMGAKPSLPSSCSNEPSLSSSSPSSQPSYQTITTELESSNEPIQWVELKTTAEYQGAHPREQQKFERKLLRFWAQSFLLGVPRIVVGYRSREGLLTRMEEFETQRIPGLVSSKGRLWDGNVCINVASAFLEFLRETIRREAEQSQAAGGQDGGAGVWRISRRRDEKVVRVFRVSESGTGDILRPEFKVHRERLLAMEIANKLGGDGAQQ